MPKPSGKRRFQPRDRGPRRNDKIRAQEIRVIGPTGKNLGIIETRKALKMATDAGLDLIEISPGANPPVCRILDYGKFLYEESKKKKDNKAVVSKLKEIKFRVKIENHDFMTKMRRAERFLFDGNKVKFTMTFRGRENEHRDIGFVRFDEVTAKLAHVATPDSEPKLAGRNLGMILSPLPKDRRKLIIGHIDDEFEEDDEDDDEVEVETEGESEALEDNLPAEK